MRWENTVARACRYGDIAGRLFEQANVLWEHSDEANDYQGFANVFAAMPDGTFVHYEWTYGSCSGCDEWESRGLSDDQIEQEMRNAMVVLPDQQTAARYLRLEGEFAEAKVPSANTPTNGSIPGMLRYLGGGISEDFKAIGAAFHAWVAARAEGGSGESTRPRQ